MIVAGLAFLAALAYVWLRRRSASASPRGVAAAMYVGQARAFFSPYRLPRGRFLRARVPKGF